MPARSGARTVRIGARATSFSTSRSAFTMQSLVAATRKCLVTASPNSTCSAALQGRRRAAANDRCRDRPWQCRSWNRRPWSIPLRAALVEGDEMAEESWHEARLIPTSGINGADEQERRARTALVEVKTGENVLVAEQLENYLDIARDEGFDAVLTISNEIPPVAGQHPTPVDKRKLRKVALHHLSWTKILSEAVMQKEFRGVADPDQAWILGELIRYLEHPRSGAMEFSDMGESWVTTREAVRAGTLRA